MTALQFSISLIGCGNMGGAMLAGWLKAGLAPENAVIVDPSPPASMLDEFKPLGVRFGASADQFSPVDVVVVAVKPQVMDKVLPTISPLIGENTVVVSVAAGKTLDFMQNHLGEGAQVRAMPNTPALIGLGATVAVGNGNVTEKQKEQIGALLSANGIFEWVEDEALIDAVTALSGSGPAYVFHLAECMTAAGTKLGLSPEMAARLARQTVFGAGSMLFESEETAEQLRSNVTSPGGTTAAALSVLMEDQVMEKLFANALKAARDRSQELS